MWQNADFLDAQGRPVRIFSLDAPYHHADGREDTRASVVRDRSPSVVADLESAETKAMVRRFVDTLPRGEREIARRVFWSGETQTAVAADLGVSKMAVSKAISRIAKRGRNALPQYEHLRFG
jgi:DNA-directed RNA polymerase specialized sigma subunit